jgi:organic radical activating enzyme
MVSDLDEIKEKLDMVSKTFCVAKWKQVTTHLASGLTHSCHHAKMHKIPLSELKENISALHNTRFKKEVRKHMLAGEIVPDCEYCNLIEESGNFADRFHKSRMSWAEKYIPEIISNPWDYDVFPSYFEVSFSHACNCACIYCSPTISSKWVTEIKKHGNYKTSISTRSFRECPIPEMNKAYIEAFWKWWPELYHNLDVFRITGGEPLLSKDTFKILDYIINNPNPNINFAINSNFCVNKKIFNKFIDKYKQVSKNVKLIEIYTSCEAEGERAEYIRSGLKYKEWLDNCREYLLQVPNGILYCMCTYNILSISSFKDFLKDILKLKKEFPARMMIDVATLNHPDYLQTNIISKDFLSYIEDSIDFMYKNSDPSELKQYTGSTFLEWEILKLVRLHDMVKEYPEDKRCMKNRKDFAIFIDERDKRYNKSFLKIFPEYEGFYNKCKEIDICL